MSWVPDLVQAREDAEEGGDGEGFADRLRRRGGAVADGKGETEEGRVDKVDELGLAEAFARGGEGRGDVRA